MALSKDDPNVVWCANLFAMVKDGGAWGVPRSGLVFRKRGETLVLVERMPHEVAMPITREQLAEQQQSDFDGTKEYFGAAGIEVKDESQ